MIKRNWMKKILYPCLAVASVLSLAGPSVVANAHAHSHMHKTSVHVPWKKSWNKYAADETGYSSVYLYPVKGKVSTSSWYHHINQRISAGNRKQAGTVAGWAKYFADHQTPGAFKDRVTTYPEYQHLSDAGWNANAENKNQSWLVDVPYGNIVGLGAGGDLSGSIEADYKRAEMVANLPMNDLTAHQTQVLTDWAEPMQNGRRLLTTFHAWMKKNHNAPQITVGNGQYDYSASRKRFVPINGMNGYGKTYQYNPKSGKYVRVSNQAEMNVVHQREANVQHSIDFMRVQEDTAVVHNPLLSNSSKNYVIQLLRRPGATLPSAYHQAAMHVTDLNQAHVLLFSAKQEAKAEKASIDETNQHDNTTKAELASIQSTKYFHNLAKPDKLQVLRMLIRHPKLLRALAQHAGGGNKALVTSKASAPKEVKAASRHAKGRKQSPKNLITSDQQLSRELSLLHDDEEALGRLEGMKMNGSNLTY